MTIPQLKGNGAVRKAKWIAIALTVLGLLFGTNIIGALVTQYFRAEAVSGKVIENEETLDSHAIILSEHETKIAVIDNKLDNIEKLQERTIKLLETNR